MKTVHKNFTSMLLALLIITGFNTVSAQDSTGTQTKEQNTIEELITAKNFVFVPQTVLPANGRTRQLTSYYDVTLKNDTLISFLPYFGRAYTAPLNPTKSELDFTSTNFDYNITPLKKGGWDVMIKPHDETAVRQFVFTVFDNGTASLRVNSNNTQPISFNGYITEPRQRKQK